MGEIIDLEQFKQEKQNKEAAENFADMEDAQEEKEQGYKVERLKERMDEKEKREVETDKKMKKFVDKLDPEINNEAARIADGLIESQEESIRNLGIKEKK